MKDKKTTFSIADEFLYDLQNIVEKKCFDVVGSPRSGSMISLNIGNKKRLVSPENIAAGRGSPEVFRGEYEIFIKCYWKILKKGKPVCDANDSCEENGLIFNSISLLLNNSINRVKVIDEELSLKIEFDNETEIIIYCNQKEWDFLETNYSFFTPNKIYAIGKNGEVRLGS